MKKSVLAVAVFSCVSLAGATAWWLAGRPYSLAEARLLFALRAGADGPTLDLGRLMPGEWELACDAHGFGGDFRVERYGRTYPAVGQMQDGAWGIVFIRADGTFQTAASTCGASGVILDLGGCVLRGKAILHRTEKASSCPTLKALHG